MGFVLEKAIFKIKTTFKFLKVLKLEVQNGIFNRLIEIVFRKLKITPKH